MMLKLTLVAVALLAFTGAAEAAAKPKKSKSVDSYIVNSSTGGHKMAGCGLGSMVIEDQTKWAQVGAAFLNGTGFQTFGITFGTSNCTEDGVATAEREKDAFIEANYADLRREVVVGNGAYLSSLASLYGCKGEAALSFGQALQKNQEQVLKASSTDASSVIDAVVRSENAGCQG